MLLPATVAVVALSFSLSQLRLYARRRRPDQLVWTVALLLEAVAGAAFIAFLVFDRAET